MPGPVQTQGRAERIEFMPSVVQFYFNRLSPFRPYWARIDPDGAVYSLAQDDSKIDEPVFAMGPHTIREMAGLRAEFGDNLDVISQGNVPASVMVKVNALLAERGQDPLPVRAELVPIEKQVITKDKPKPKQKDTVKEVATQTARTGAVADLDW